MFGERKDYLLRAVHFCPGVSIVLGGTKYSAMTFWDLEKYPDVLVEEKPNGDIWFVTPWDGRVREIKNEQIAWRLLERPGTEAAKVEPAAAKRREAERMYADKFGPRKPTEAKK